MTNKMNESKEKKFPVQRVQTGIRIEKRLLKVLKAVTEYHDITLGDPLEGIVLHAFDGKFQFGENTIKTINEFKKIYRLDYDSTPSHWMIDMEETK